MFAIFYFEYLANNTIFLVLIELLDEPLFPKERAQEKAVKNLMEKLGMPKPKSKQVKFTSSTTSFGGDNSKKPKSPKKGMYYSSNSYLLYSYDFKFYESLDHQKKIFEETVDMLEDKIKENVWNEILNSHKIKFSGMDCYNESWKLEAIPVFVVEYAIDGKKERKVVLV